MSDPVVDVPRELEPAPAAPTGALALLRRPDFRRLFLAVAASELGDSLHYIALMWFALDVGGPLGVVAVRLADSVPPSSSACTAASPPTASAASA